MSRKQVGESRQADHRAAADASGPLSAADLADWFTASAHRESLVGLEVEYGVVRQETARAVRYGDGGSRQLIVRLADEFDGDPILEGGLLVGVELPDGARFSLEAASTLEYSSCPLPCVVDAVRDSRRRLARAAAVADGLGMYLLTGGLLPFESPDSLDWIPKPRMEMLRRHFRLLGDDGSLADRVIGTTLSTQVSFDARTPVEYIEKLKTLLGASPFVAAMLAATPPLDGGQAKPASLRMHYWRRVDPKRCQNLTGLLWSVGNMDELVALLSTMPMICRRVDGQYARAPAASFAQLMEASGADRPVSIADWSEHLHQVWPTVRPRRTLETRLPDGQPWRLFALVPGIFAGLVEERSVRADVMSVLSEVSAAELDRTLLVGADQGWGGLSGEAKEICRELMRLARVGLDLQRPTDGRYDDLIVEVDTVAEIMASNGSLAAELTRSWEQTWRRDPVAYTRAMMVPPH